MLLYFMCLLKCCLNVSFYCLIAFQWWRCCLSYVSALLVQMCLFYCVVLPYRIPGIHVPNCLSASYDICLGPLILYVSIWSLCLAGRSLSFWCCLCCQLWCLYLLCCRRCLFMLSFDVLLFFKVYFGCLFYYFNVSGWSSFIGVHLWISFDSCYVVHRSSSACVHQANFVLPTLFVLYLLCICIYIRIYS